MDGGAGGGSGDHAAGGGGYCGGTGQSILGSSYNGDVAGTQPEYGEGGSYFYCGSYSNAFNYLTGKVLFSDPFAVVGGQGAGCPRFNCQGGDGGIAGKGGNIMVSDSAHVYAYNGNKYTDKSNNHENLLYDENLQQTVNEENQLEIYAQNGILRDVYKYDIFFDAREYRYVDYFEELFGEDCSSDIDTFSSNTEVGIDMVHENYLIRPRKEKEDLKTGYINSQNDDSIYGIGSGAGYIELSNGTYSIISNE